METSEVSAKPKKQRNWWKVGFFVALFAFEVAREIAVVQANEGVVHGTWYHFFEMDGYVSAKGAWKRIDDGDGLLPQTVTIECRPEAGICLEAYVTSIDNQITAPEIDWFEADFTPTAITYQNDNPECVRYSVRIDIQLEKVFSLRERKTGATNPQCSKVEPRMETMLGDAYQQADSTEGHFVPLLSALRAAIN